MNSIGKINTMQKITKNSDGTFTANFDEPNSTSVYSANIFFDSVKRAGLNGPLGFYNCFQWDKYGMAMLAKPFTPEWDKLIIQTVQDLENARKKNNWNEFVYVCGDEPGSSVVRLNTVKAITKNIKKAATATPEPILDIIEANLSNCTFRGVLVFVSSVDFCATLPISV
jgi:hypothetical protein